MRSLIFMLAMGGMLPVTVVQPIVGVILYYWLSLMSPNMEVWGFAQHLPWALMAALATVIGCVVAREPRRLPLNGMFALILSFMVLSSIASIFALGPGILVVPAWERVMKVLLFCLISLALVTTRERVHALTWVVVISLGFYGVVGGGFAILTGGRDHVFGPPSSIIADNNQLAVALLMTLPFMNYLRRQSKHRVARISLIGAMLLTLLAILATYSRGAFLGLLAIGLFFWLKSKRKIASAAVVAIVLACGVSFMPAKWVARMDTIQTYHKDNSANERLTVWREALGIVLARPLTGGGYRSTATSSVLHQFYPDARPLAVHSIWLEVLSENGFPTFLVWLSMLGLGIANTRRILRIARDRPDLTWARDFANMAQVSIIAYVSAGTFLSLGYYDLYFLILAILAAINDMLKRSNAPMAVRYRSGEQAEGFLTPSWRTRRAIQ